MQRLSPNIKKYHWLDIVEALSVLGSIGGSIASVVSQQVAFASIPLSLSVALNLVNRSRLLGLINQSHQTAFTQLIQENVETQVKLGSLTEQIAQVQQFTTTLGQDINNLHTYTQTINSGQTKTAEMVYCLREIDTCTQTIRIHPKSAKAYYNRGLTYTSLGDKEVALHDYSEAIIINASYAEAYQMRGTTRADLGNKKGAIQDLRTAAKLFLDEGDIANYQKTRDLSMSFHELTVEPSTEFEKVTEEITLECLFS